MWRKTFNEMRRWCVRHDTQKIIKAVEANSNKEPQRIRCMKMLQAIPVVLFEHYHSSSGQSLTISVPDACLDHYIERIKSITKIVEKELPLPSIDISVEMKTLTVDNFLVSADGYYLDAEKAIARFKAAGLKLCAAMENTDDAEFGIHEHNRRIVSKLFINMREVSHTLIDVSLTN